jgi:hypothetical protein
VPLVTLRDAALFITKLPKVEQQASEWQTAAEVLIVIGEHGGDPMFARIAMIKARHRHEPNAALPRARVAIGSAIDLTPSVTPLPLSRRVTMQVGKSLYVRSAAASWLKRTMDSNWSHRVSILAYAARIGSRA